MSKVYSMKGKATRSGVNRESRIAGGGSDFDLILALIKKGVN